MRSSIAQLAFAWVLAAATASIHRQHERVKLPQQSSSAIVRRVEPATEALAHLLRFLTDRDEDAVVVSLDGVGAFDHVRRAAFMSKVEPASPQHMNTEAGFDFGEQTHAAMPWQYADPVKGYLRHGQEHRPVRQAAFTVDELSHFTDCGDWVDVRNDFFAKYKLTDRELYDRWLSTDGSKQQLPFWDYAYGDQGPQRLTSFTDNDVSSRNLNQALLNHLGSNFPATLTNSKAPGASEAPPRWLTKYLETVIEPDEFIRNNDFLNQVCGGVVGQGMVANELKGRYPVVCLNEKRNYPASKELIQSRLKGWLDSNPPSQQFVLLTVGYDVHPAGILEAIDDPDWAPLMNDSRLIAWYGHQTIAVHPKLRNFPLGVTWGNKPRGIAALLQRFRTEGYPQKTHKLIVNFGSITNCMREQLAVKAKTVWPFASVLPSPSLGLKMNPIKGRSDADVTHLTTMAKFRFALSPHGVGADCYRTWEALYVGTIPIVVRTSDTFDRVYSDLPVLLVDSLNDINETMLDQVWENFQAKTFNFERLSLKFWERELHGF